jgi:signal transduction histidine kinase
METAKQNQIKEEAKPATAKLKSSFESKALIVFTILFAVGLVASWGYAMKVRQTVAGNNGIATADTGALIEVEHIRNIAESQLSNARSFFLLGSRSLFEKQKSDKQDLADALTSFEKKYSLPQIPDIIKKIQTIEDQQQQIFDQAMEFREKQTESKIVGQFYQAKTAPMRTQINQNLDEIVKIHKAELSHARADAKKTAKEAEVQIPRGMMWFSGFLGFIFLGMALLVIRMIRERTRKLAERERLYLEAQHAVQSRDEVISAVARDFEEPLKALSDIAASMKMAKDPVEIEESGELIKSCVFEIENEIKDIYDQKKADMGNLVLRLDQSGIDEILDEARLMLQPLAKQRDVRLQIESVNPPVLAFFDRERVLRVLSNLIGNAIKFSPRHGRVTVKVRSDQQFVNISVTDSGSGVPESHRADLFRHFWQARKTAEQGAGVGLAVVKTIVEAHGGTVKLENALGHGSTFTFSLPRRRPVGAHIKKPAAPTVRIKRSSSGDEAHTH